MTGVTVSYLEKTLLCTTRPAQNQHLQRARQPPRFLPVAGWHLNRGQRKPSRGQGLACTGRSTRKGLRASHVEYVSALVTRD